MNLQGWTKQKLFLCVKQGCGWGNAVPAGVVVCFIVLYIVCGSVEPGGVEICWSVLECVEAYDSVLEFAAVCRRMLR